MLNSIWKYYAFLFKEDFNYDITDVIDVHSSVHKRMAFWLLVTFCVYLFSMYFWTGSESNHRYLYYIATVLPFVVLLAWYPHLMRVLAKSKIILLTIILSLIAISSVLYTGNYNNLVEDLFDAVRYGFLILTLLGLVTYLSAVNRNYPTIIIGVLACASALSAAYFTQIYFQEIGGIEIGARMEAGLAYAHHPIRMSEMYAVGALSAIGLLSSVIWWRFKLMWGACFITSVIPMILSQSRAPLLALVSATTALLVLQRRWHTMVALIGIALTIVVIFTVYDVGYRDVTNPDNVLVRIKIWKVALSDIRENMIVGMGWLDPGQISEPVKGVGLETVHNLYLSVLRQGGILGFFLFFGLVGYCLYVGSQSVNVNTEFAVAFAILVFYCINGFSIERWIYINPSLPWLQFWIPLSFLVTRELTERVSYPERRN